MTQAEKDDVDAARLGDLKAAKRAEIDLKTERLIKEGGFDYNGVHFSLSDNAQKNWNRLYSKYLAGKLTYPVTISSSDLSIQYQLQNADAVEAFYAAMDSAINSQIAAGQQLKLQVTNAATKAELDAIVDDR